MYGVKRVPSLSVCIHCAVTTKLKLQPRRRMNYCLNRRHSTNESFQSSSVSAPSEANCDKSFFQETVSALMKSVLDHTEQVTSATHAAKISQDLCFSVPICQFWAFIVVVVLLLLLLIFCVFFVFSLFAVFPAILITFSCESCPALLHLFLVLLRCCLISPCLFSLFIDPPQ